ncbi:MAG: PKD domain-containing protein [bacterium]|nr:PKD domain-containing protein [bacterium]
MIIKPKIIFSFIAIFISIFFIFNGLNFRSGINKTDVKAAVTDNVAGYAWSENIGWISFNSVNCDANNDGKSEGAVGCPAAGTNMVAYGVNLNTDNTLSGYAWSENIGWISFNPAAVIGCPAGTCQPRYNSGTGEFLGWARALANGGGWDGWISLNCLNGGVCATSNYKVSKTGSNFIGYAWGGDVAGWIKFNPAFGGVYLANAPPVAANLSITPPTVTALCTSGAAYGFQWTFSDSGDTESKFQLQIDNDSNFLTPTVDRTFSGLTNADGSVNTQSVLLTSAADAPSADKLSYNTTYYWRVQVWDSSEAFSGWITPAAPLFTTPIHMYPTADYICSPSTTSCPVNHSQFEPISFTDRSICYDNNNNSTPCASRSWSFGDGSPLSTLSNPKHTYTAQGNFALGFTMTDPGGFTCTKNSSINIGVASPKWKEVIPK